MEIKNNILAFRITPTEKKRLNALSKKYKMSPSAFAQTLIRSLIADRKEFMQDDTLIKAITETMAERAREMQYTADLIVDSKQRLETTLKQGIPFDR